MRDKLNSEVVFKISGRWAGFAYRDRAHALAVLRMINVASVAIESHASLCNYALPPHSLKHMCNLDDKV